MAAWAAVHFHVPPFHRDRIRDQYPKTRKFFFVISSGHLSQSSRQIAVAGSKGHRTAAANNIAQQINRGCDNQYKQSKIALVTFHRCHLQKLAPRSANTSSIFCWPAQSCRLGVPCDTVLVWIVWCCLPWKYETLFFTTFPPLSERLHELWKINSQTNWFPKLILSWESQKNYVGTDKLRHSHFPLPRQVQTCKMAWFM